MEEGSGVRQTKFNITEEYRIGKYIQTRNTSKKEKTEEEKEDKEEWKKTIEVLNRKTKVKQK